MYIIGGISGSPQAEGNTAILVQAVLRGWCGALVLHSIIDFCNTHTIIYAGGIIGEGGEEICHVKKDKQAMKKAAELARELLN